ncbi:MAG: flagellar motor switch protein FliM [Verrucomicrobia bacterium]|nr:flagellar motor switch protein FliM [Verrucomicrobiota bacterium]
MDTPESPSPSSEVLSSSDVERLLAEVAVEQPTTTVHKASGEKDTECKESIHSYDFRQPSCLSATELRKLRLRHEEFIRALASRLSMYLRLEFALQMSKLHTVSFQKFTESLANPTHLTLFKVEPLRGICLLEISPRLGLTIVDRLLGGPAHSINAERELSEIEVGLLDQAISIIVGEWCNHWSGLQELRPALLGHESNGRFLQTSPHDTVMLVLAMETRVGDCVEQMQIAIPYYTLEPLVLKLNTTLEPLAHQAETSPATSLRWNERLDDLKIPVTAEWPELPITVRQLTQLKVGDLFPLSPQFVERVQIRLAKLPKFIGRLGTRGPCWAVELTEVLKS